MLNKLLIFFFHICEPFEHTDIAHHGKRSENPDRAENQSDCKIRYRAFQEKKV